MGFRATSDKEAQIQYISERCAELAKTIEDNKELITQELLKYESFETAYDELWRSIDCLKNISKEFKYLADGKVSLMCTFFPVNLPLYSLVIFAVVPGFMADEVVVRPPQLMSDVVKKICDFLNLLILMPHVKIIDLERSLFVETHVSIADVVLFTGRYENAKIVQAACPDALFIYNGAGINPVVVTETADLKLATDKTVEMRAFNSGQDCAGSDAVLIHEKIAKDFTDKLVEELKHLKVGEYSDRDVKVGKLVKVDQIEVIKKFFAQHKEKLVYGGKIDSEKGTVFPTVIVEDINNLDEITYTEFFSPVFYLLIYRTKEDLKRYFAKNTYGECAMYASVFGTALDDSIIPNSIILHNQIVNDVERGNHPYGGYGPKANYTSYHGIYNYRPLLVSQEIAEYLDSKLKS